MDYLFGWFALDVFAIIPFSDFASMGSSTKKEEGNDLNSLARIAKIGRLYKLVKLTKLLRVLKIIKEKNKLLKYVRELVSLGQGFERLMFINLLFLMITHIVACLWIFFASFKPNYEGTWMEGGADEMNKADQYLTSFYWTVQTITTVGYGDTSINTKTEKIACILLMVFGVVAFGLLSGSLTSIL